MNDKTTPVEITDWWPGQGASAGKIIFKVRYADGHYGTTTKRIDLNLPGDKIKDVKYLYNALRELSGH